MSIAKIMSTRVVSVHMDDSLQSLRELFAATGFHHLVVVHDNKLQGIISDRDLMKSISPFVDTVSERTLDRATLDKKAHQIMTREVISLNPTDSVFSAIELFNSHKISLHITASHASRHLRHNFLTSLDFGRQGQ